MLLRHAKSDWPDGVPDHERPLASRGRRDAPTMGRWLRAEGHVPDHVVCSTALRTRQTWELVQPELHTAPSTVFEPRVYAASVRQLAEVVGSAPEAARTLLLVGHNPGIEEFAVTLAAANASANVSANAGTDASANASAIAEADSAGGGRAAELDRMRGKFPTAAIAVFEWSGGWDQLFPGVARLARFVTPRDL